MDAGRRDGPGDDPLQRGADEGGLLLALEGLRPTSQGARISFAGGKATVTDGPFTEAKEIVGGYWLIQTRSKEEALEWASRCPAADHELIELRQVYEMSDFDIDPASELGEQVDRVSAAVSGDAPAG